MVVSFNIYEVLSVVKLIACIFFMIFIFVRRNETWNKVVRLSLVSGMFLINLFQIPMEIQMDKPYVMSFVLVILWFINAVIMALELGKDNWILQKRLPRVRGLLYYLSNSSSFSLSSFFICFTGSINVRVSFSKSLTNSLESPKLNLLQIHSINLSMVL